MTGEDQVLDQDNTPSVKAILLGAGIGTRLQPLTDHTPKCLIPIGEKPLLQYWFDSIERAGVRNILINTHHLAEQVREYIKDVNDTQDLHIEEAFESTLLGSAGTIHANGDYLDDGDIGLIVYADNLSNLDVSAFLDYHLDHGHPVTMMLFRADHPKNCGIVELNDDGLIVDFVEKPNCPKSDLANAGVYAVTSEAYREMADMDGFDLGFDVIPKFINRMRGWVWEGYHLDIGTHEALAKASRDVQTLRKFT